MNVRTRMAPSPTGEYHIGHIRTLLYNYAFAKKHNGKFVIRIEDTDRERYVEGAVDRILDIIKDYGFSWDEGPRVGGPFAPYIQSERLPLYKKHAQELVEKGHAYYCFCTEERLNKIREEQRAQGLPTTKYDKHCLKLTPEEIKKNLADGVPHVVRLKVPENETITFKDEVLGEVSINSNDIDDQVLLKTDGFPTYHLGVVVDDHLMEITHVMRGIDWLPSTPKHVLLYKYFGWQLPVYIHLPNLKELGGNKKLSKRYGSVSALEFLQEGYLPEALVNFIMFLGWNPGGEKEIYTLDEFVKEFSIERIHKTDLVAFDRQKLLWMNGYYVRNLSEDDLWQKILSWGKRFNVKINGSTFPNDYSRKILSLVKDRIKILSEYNLLTDYFYKDVSPDGDLLISYCGSKEKTKEILQAFKEIYLKTDPASWNFSAIEEENHKLLEARSYKPKEAFMTLRIAITGASATPSLSQVLEVLGKEKVLLRIDSALKLL